MMPLPTPAVRRAAKAINNCWRMNANASAADSANYALNSLEVEDLIALARCRGVELGRLQKRKRHASPESASK